jgi:hypothetical protein
MACDVPVKGIRIQQQPAISTNCPECGEMPLHPFLERRVLNNSSDDTMKQHIDKSETFQFSKFSESCFFPTSRTLITLETLVKDILMDFKCSPNLSS